MGEVYQTFREELTLILLKLFQKIAEGGRNTLRFILQSHHYPDTKTRKRYHKKRKLQTNIPDKVDAKIFHKILANKIQQYIKRITHHD